VTHTLDLPALVAMMKALGMDPGVISDIDPTKASASTQPKPFTPDEARRNKAVVMPPEVIASVNELLSEKFSTRITITKDELIDRIMSKMAITRQEIIKLGFLDIETVYEDAGWVVKFDSPAYDENYTPFYIFERRK
jgi:hypothetical protein